MKSFFRRKEGVTLLQAVIGILMIGVLISITINSMLSFREKTYINSIKSDLDEAYSIARDLHTSYPDRVITFQSLVDYGFRPSRDITVTIVDGSSQNLMITATHPGVASSYAVNHKDQILELKEGVARGQTADLLEEG